jgi:uncharacterized protein YndB with AHSA1/START domain
MKELIATSSVVINASSEKVWDALVNPVMVKQYFFGTDIISDWQPGSPITWKGEWKGKPYEDKGTVIKVEKEKYLEYTHFSPLAGQPDTPEHYHTIVIELSGGDNKTTVTLSQDNNKDATEKEQSQQNWNTVLEDLKKLLER